MSIVEICPKTFLSPPVHTKIYFITDINLLYHSGESVRPNEALNISAPLDPYYWRLPSGAGIERSKLMVVLTNLTGLYFR